MLSNVLTTSTRGVVIGIENRTQNVDKSRNEYLLPSQDSIRAGLGGEGLDPSPRALEARTTHKSTSRRCSRIWDPFGSQIDARRIEHLLVERRSDPEGDLLMPPARRHAT